MQRRTVAKARNRGFDPPAQFSSVNSGGDPPMMSMKGSKRVYRRSPSPIGKLIQSRQLPPMVYDFFHARTGVQGCFVAGVIRCCYASLYLYSILLMTIQMPTLFDPRKGLMPYSITGEDVGEYDYSVFEFAPQSSLVVYAMFLLGIASGVLLLLGIEPRKAAIGVFFFLHNLQSHNTKIFDHEFRMNKMWAFFLMLLPLDHFTVFDQFGGLEPKIRRRLKLPPRPKLNTRNYQQSTSWPMWPFRLWQIYTCMVYMGAGLCKLNTQPWTSGNALSWCWYDETVGRFYPAFVFEMLYNRLISIKLQTWLSLLIENLCYITIWPLKTRKLTFAAVLLLHVGIELALVMHIFEYLSVLGWLCFFVYPNDGKKSNSEGLIMSNKKNDDGTTALASLRRRKTVETVVAVSLLYLLIFDIFPREEVEQLMPTPLAYLVWKFVYPPAFVNRNLDNLVHLVGIHADPYILFKGKPGHTQSRMTAVIRFSDEREPILHREPEWAKSSFLRREIDYWYDAYSYYLMAQDGDLGNVPYYAALSVNLAELYSGGNIDRRYNDITIGPSNEVESVSIVVHKRTGSEDPAPPEWGLFSSIPREWTYDSECQFVFQPQRVQLEDEPFQLAMDQIWGIPDHYATRPIKNNCVNYNPDDEDLHRKGQYGEPETSSGWVNGTPGDDDDEVGEGGSKSPTNQDEDGDDNGTTSNEENDEDVEDGDEDAGEDAYPVQGSIRESEDNDDQENRDDEGSPNADTGEEDDGEDEAPGDAGEGDNDEDEEEGNDGGPPNADADEGDDGEDEDPPIVSIRRIESDEDGEDEAPGDAGEGDNDEDEEDGNDGETPNANTGDEDEDEEEDPPATSVRRIESDEDEEGESPGNQEEDEDENNSAESVEDGNGGEESANSGDDNEDGSQEGGGSDDQHRQLRSRS